MSPAVEFRRHVPLARARREMRSGDLLLFRPLPLTGWSLLSPRDWRRWLTGVAITSHGRSRYCHAGKLVMVRREPFVAEMIDSCGGGRLHPLERYLHRHSGRIDIFRPDPSGAYGFDAEGSVQAMLDLILQPYSRLAVAQAFLLRLPGLRKFCRSFDDDNESVWRRPPFCSSAVAYADQFGGGADPVRELGFAYTEPGDLARSRLYEYLLTVTSDTDTERTADL